MDALRGFAIFGILWVNMSMRSGPIQTSGLPDPTDWLDWLIAFTGNSKFRSMFAFLFGASLMIQVDRAESDGTFMRTHLKRMSTLFLFGALHVAFFWPGDILALYAAVGVALACMRKASSRTILAMVVPLLATPVLLESSGIHFFDVAQLKADVVSAYPIYEHGGFWQITARRVYDFHSFWVPSLILSAPRVLAMMLLGILFQRHGYLAHSELHLRVWKKVCFWGYLVGIPASMTFAFWKTNTGWSNAFTLSAKVAHMYGTACLCMAYVATVVLLAQTKTGRRLVRNLAPAGRMSLTCYLGHCVIGSLLFCGYGLGLFGHVSVGEGIAIAMAICVFQVAGAQVWFQHFTMGPVEWVWRWAVRGQRPVFRNSVAPLRVPVEIPGQLAAAPAASTPVSQAARPYSPPNPGNREAGAR
jgi:uncharacterized protein